MMKYAEKVSRPSASSSSKLKKMQKSLLEPKSIGHNKTEYEATADIGVPLLSYNLVNIPAYPPVQRKEPEDEELQMKPSSSCPECEEEEIQAKPIDNGVTPIVQRQEDLEDEDEIQAKSPIEEEEEEKLQAKSMSDSLIPKVQRQTDPDAEEEESLQGKFLPVQRKVPHFSYNLMNILAYPPVQKQAKPNRTGMPDQLKAGIESLSGIDMSDVRVHANSDKPACLNALAYAQGNEIHLGAGQERHLSHEAWHVVQQKQGRVRPTMQMMGVAVNGDVTLEREADEIGGIIASKNRRESLVHLQNQDRKHLSMISHHSAVQLKDGENEIECTATATFNQPPRGLPQKSAVGHNGSSHKNGTRTTLTNYPQTNDLFRNMQKAPNGMPMYVCAEPNSLSVLVSHMTTKEKTMGIDRVDITPATYIKKVTGAIPHEIGDTKAPCDTCSQWLTPNGGNYQHVFPRP